MKDKFNEVYLNIINECNQKNGVITEGFGRWLNNCIRTKKSKATMIWEMLKAFTKTNQLSGPKPNKGGTARLWIAPDGRLKIKMAEDIFNDLKSDKPSKKEFPVYVIDGKNKVKQKLVLTWSDNEDDLANKFNEALKKAGIDDLTLKTAKIVKKDAEEKAKADAAAAEQEMDDNDDNETDVSDDEGGEGGGNE